LLCVADSEQPHRKSRPFLPPPPEELDDSPGSVHFPRHEPPPSSLEAMVRSRPGSPLLPERHSSWIWLLALLAGVAVAAYFLGIHR
jgi:hypothetical protein